MAIAERDAFLEEDALYDEDAELDQPATAAVHVSHVDADTDGEFGFEPLDEHEAEFEHVSTPAIAFHPEPADEPDFTAHDEVGEPAAFVDFTPLTDSDAPADPAPVEHHPDIHPISDDFQPASVPAANPVGALISTMESELGDLLAPRIAIHLFCRNAETAAAATRAATDRRMQRASPKVVRGGLTEAIAIYQEQPTPPLIVVECLEPARELLAKLEALAEVCDPSTKVVVIGVANDIALYRELMRRGVSEYLVPPIDPLQLIQTIAGLYADPGQAFVGRTLAFIGAKGGVGSSTVAHNVAYALAEQIEVNTVVVDYDLPFGTAGLDFNQDPLQGIHDALSQPDRLDPVLLDRMTAHCTERLSLFAAPVSLEDTYDIGPEAFEEVFNSIRTTAPFVVLDLPHLWSGWIRQTLLSSDDVVIVATPDLASLRNAKNMVDLIRKVRPNDSPPKLVLNQMGMPSRPEIPVKEFAKALQLEPTLVLPFDAKLFGEAANNGQMLAELNPKAKSVEGLLQFAQALARREAPATPTKPRSFLERLLKRN